MNNAKIEHLDGGMLTSTADNNVVGSKDVGTGEVATGVDAGLAGTEAANNELGDFTEGNQQVEFNHDLPRYGDVNDPEDIPKFDAETQVNCVQTFKQMFGEKTGSNSSIGL